MDQNMNPDQNQNMEMAVESDERRPLAATPLPIFPNGSRQMPGFQATLRSLQHIYAYLPDDLFREMSSDSLLVLQLAGRTYNKEEEELVEGLKNRAPGEMCPDWESGDRAGSFFELVEGNKLISHLWSRRDFLLFNPRVISRDPDKRLWVENGPPKSREEVATHSLVEYDGTRPIEDDINQLFGSRLSPTGHQCLRLPMMPTILRVLYKPAETASVRFDKLQQFYIYALDIEPQDGMIPRYALGGTGHAYVLIATVRLRAKPDEPDFVRTYDQFGRYLVPYGESRIIRDDQWEVGQQDHSYMLVYASMGDDNEPSIAFSNEVFPLSEASEHRIDELKACCEVRHDPTSTNMDVTSAHMLSPDFERLSAERAAETDHGRSNDGRERSPTSTINLAGARPDGPRSEATPFDSRRRDTNKTAEMVNDRRETERIQSQFEGVHPDRLSQLIQTSTSSARQNSSDPMTRGGQKRQFERKPDNHKRSPYSLDEYTTNKRRRS
ncbi:hypothetical protein F4818DRAFT_438856 [Hypoxylon cercidicola]|nr:hypothetical protein F4818DRAFT_438856 [Hypoxylon cercidicola]